MEDPPPKYEEVVGSAPQPQPPPTGFHPPPYPLHPYPYNQSTMIMPSAPVPEGAACQGYPSQQTETPFIIYVPGTRNGAQVMYAYQLSSPVPVPTQVHYPPVAPSAVPLIRYPAPDTAAFASEPEFKFIDKSTRLAFVMRVFSILYFQFLVIMGLISLFFFEPSVRRWSRANREILIISFVCTWVVLLISCCECTRRKSPQNVIFLVMFPLAMGVFLGTVSSIFDTWSPLLIAGVMSFVCGAITLFSLIKSFDFTFCTGVTVASVINLLLYAGVALFEKFPLIYLTYCCMITEIFSIGLAYVVLRMMENNYKHSIDPEEWIFGAHSVYVDIFTGILLMLHTLCFKNSSDPSRRDLQCCCGAIYFVILFLAAVYYMWYLVFPRRPL